MNKRSFWQLSRKIPLIVVGTSLISALIIMAFAEYQIEKFEEKAVQKNFQNIAVQYINEVEGYFENIQDDLTLTATSPITQKALIAFAKTWDMFEGIPEKDLQRLYQAENSYAPDEREKLDFAENDTSAYSIVHKQYHNWFRKLTDIKGYEDIFLVDPTGNVVYSVKKNADFATNLKLGEWRDSELANIARDASELSAGNQVFKDFKAYAPTNNAAVAFIAQPVVFEGQNIGVLVLALPKKKLNDIFAEKHGLDATGEAILLGQDRLARNQSPLIERDTVLVRKIKGRFVNEAFNNKAGVTTAEIDGVDKYVSYTPMKFFSTNYALLVVENYDELFQIIETTRYTMLTGLLLIGGLVCVIGVLVGHGISKPIIEMSGMVGQLANGNAQSLMMHDRGDELGDMARSLEQIYTMGVENLSIRTALDNATTCMMVTDNDRQVTYMNRAFIEMAQGVEKDIQQSIPGFSANEMVGERIEIYESESSVQSDLLDGLVGPRHVRMVMGTRTFDLTAAPIFGARGNQHGCVIEWEDITEKLAEEIALKSSNEENYRIRVALENATTCIMVADRERKITYMNPAIVAMMRNAEGEIRKAIPHFDIDNSLGQSIDIYHRDPRVQAEILDDLNGVHRTKMKLGERTFTLTAASVRDRTGDHLGTVVEWRDITSELQVQQEVDNVVKAVSRGDFSQTIDIGEQEGFMASLTAQLNVFKETVSDIFEELAESQSALVKGNLQYQIDKDYEGKFETLKQDTNQTILRLKQIVSEIIAASNEIANASTEIASGSIDLSQRTENQASSLEETAASMEEMSMTVKQNADNALQANDLAGRARDVAQEGGNVVEQAVSAMSSIESSSQKVSDIIGVIDEIAFQTNLLALNAAVEAARAGDAGKGFAVVASEVRTLAQRSSEAAKDIKSLILDSNSQVREGVKLVGATGSSLSNIVESIKQVADIVSDIATASQQQASGVGEINAAITQMDEMTQQNAALVEESSANARSLEDQSEKMIRLMSFFDIGDESVVLSQQAALDNIQSRNEKTNSLDQQVKITKSPILAKREPISFDLADDDYDDADWEEF